MRPRIPDPTRTQDRENLVRSSSKSGAAGAWHVGSRRFVTVVVVASVWVAGCSGSRTNPAGPERVDLEWSVPEALVPSLELIDSDPRAVPIVNEVAGAWFRRVVRGVAIDSTLPVHVRARCCGSDRIVRWGTGWIPDPSNPVEVRLAAAILIHEARHAEGYLHTCPDGRRDRTAAEGGAWAVHAAWLRHMGDDATAGTILASDIGCL